MVTPANVYTSAGGDPADCPAERAGGSRSDSRPDEGQRVVVHDLLLLCLGVALTLEVLDEGERIGETLGVRPVGAEQDVVHPEQIFQAGEVVLVVRRDRYDACEARHEGAPGRASGSLPGVLAERLEQRGHPRGTAFDHGDA